MTRLTFTFVGVIIQKSKSRKEQNMNKYALLLKEWCDALIKYQLDFPDRHIDGGIICPACHLIHGRCADTIYPFLTLADITKDEKYVIAAKKVFNWVEYNMSNDDGSTRNDTQNSWNGITVFYATGLADALLLHGHVLDNDTFAQWKARLKKAVDFLIPYIDKINTAINYRAAMCGLLPLAYKLFDDESYLASAKHYADTMYQFFDVNGLLVGECKQHVARSEHGCLPVDIGYNVEESLPALIRYVKETDDETMKSMLKKLLPAHLDFAMPDGGWDNSFGVRCDKWTYWGSRTSDGCQSAFTDFADEIPELAEMAERNFELYKKCTSDGLLHGGTMYISAKEPPCVHHTFCHAKALAHLVDTGFEYKEHIPLSFDSGNKVKCYPISRVVLVRNNAWRATFSANDAYKGERDYSSGGALTLLWNDACGIVFAASVPRYTYTEPKNMQEVKYHKCGCLTPRIECSAGGVKYTSLYGKDAILERDGLTFSSSGRLYDGSLLSGGEYRIRYCFADSALTAEYTCTEDAYVILPLIASSDDKVSVGEASVTIQKENGALISVSCDDKFIFDMSENERIFNPSGGFEAFTVSAKLEAGRTVTVNISVSAT